MNPELSENTPNVVARFLLTSTGNLIKLDAVKEPMEKVNTTEAKGRKKQDVPYPLRFRSKAERKRIYDAAARVRLSVRVFILEAVTERVNSVLANGIDLRAS